MWFRSHSLFQWPDDFDFDTTRAINSSSDRISRTTEQLKSDEAQEEAHSDDEVKQTPPNTSDVVPAGVTDKAELDPEALHNAFKFAAWSSILLVRSYSQLCSFSCRSLQRSVMLSCSSLSL